MDDFQDALLKDKKRIQFLCQLNDGEQEELFDYNKIVEYINNDAQNPILWRYKRIVSHQGPMSKTDKDYMGSSYNVKMEWEDGTVSPIGLDSLAKTDPITCAIYARENGLLDTPGWKRFKRTANREKKLFRMAKQAYLRSFRSTPKYKYGVEIPKDYVDAMRLDKLNGNTKWADATKLEMDQVVDQYQCFVDVGHRDKVRIPDGYKRIGVPTVYDCKHDG